MGQGAIEIERLTAVDAGLARALNRLFDEGMTWDEKHGRAFLANPDALLIVARWEGTPCGFLTAYRLPRFDALDSEVNLYEIGTHEDYRQRGVAAAMIAELKRWAAEVGAVNIWVLTEIDNEPAQRLYAATGGVRDEPPAVMFEYPVQRAVGPTRDREHQ
jgi:ribosomal protein S18 acetylase RimI-like enzyme